MNNQGDNNTNNQVEYLDPKCLFYQSKNSNLISMTQQYSVQKKYFNLTQLFYSNRAVNITALEELKSNSSYCNFFDSEAKPNSQNISKKSSKILNENQQSSFVNNAAEKSEGSISNSIQQQSSQNIKMKKKKNIRDILLSKRQILEQQSPVPKKEASVNFVQSYIMQRIYRKVKVHLLMKKFVNKMISFLNKSQKSFFLSSKKLRIIFSDKSDSAVVLNNSDNISSLAPFETQNISSKSKFQFASNHLHIFLHYFQQKFYMLLKNIPIFDQLSQYRIIWDVIQLASLAFFFVIIPLCICFDIITNQLIFYIALICIFLLLSDLLVNLNTTIFYRGKVISTRPEIIQTYLNNGMKRDCLTLLPLLIFFIFKFRYIDIDFQYRAFISVLYFLFYLRLEKFQLFQQRLEIRFHLSPKISQLMNLWSLLFFNIYIIHFLACAWILLSNLEHIYGYPQTWLDKQNISDDDFLSQYLFSFYFNTVTMVTVGYGDVSPLTNVERIMSICTVLSACGVFAYSISEVGAIFQEMQKGQKLIKSNMYVINSYMKQRRISNQLQHKIRHYLEYYWNESEFSSTKQEQRIINQLSDNLKENLLIEANKVFILESPILKQNFSMSTLLKTISIAQEQKYTPEEIIFLKDDLDSSIYFIERGSVEPQIEGFTNTLHKQNKNYSSILKQGQFFGEGSFFTGTPRRQTFRSLEFTTVLKIDREDFMNILTESKEDYEKFCYIRDLININGSSQFSRKCCLCSSTEQLIHTENSCPYLHFIPNFEKLKEIQIDQINFVEQNSSFINEKFDLNNTSHYGSKIKTNLTFSSDDIDSDEDEDDIISIKNHTKNLSDKQIKSNSLINSLRQKSQSFKKNTAAAVHPTIQQNDQAKQRASVYGEKTILDTKAIINQKKRGSISSLNLVALKNFNQKDGLQNQQNQDNQFLEGNQQQGNNNSKQQPSSDQSDHYLDKNEDQRKGSKPFKKDPIVFKKCSIQDINQDDFNINPLYKKNSSKQSIYQFMNNYSSMNQINQENDSQFEFLFEIDQFERMNIFEIYFPHNNYDQIITALQKKSRLVFYNKRNKSSEQKFLDVTPFSKNKRSIRKSISATKMIQLQNEQEKSSKNISYKILLNGKGNKDIQNFSEYDNLQNQNSLTSSKNILDQKSSFQENDSEDKSPVVLGLNRINIQPASSGNMNSRKSFFKRKSYIQNLSLKTSLSQQLQNMMNQ